MADFDGDADERASRSMWSRLSRTSTSPHANGVAWPRSPQTTPTAVLVVMVCGAAVATSLAMHQLVDLAHIGSAFWPPAGVMVAGLLLVARRAWPVMLGVYVLLQWGIDVASTGEAQASLLWATANAVGFTLAADWIRRARADALDTLRAVVMFGLAAGSASMVGALVGTAGSVMAGSELAVWRLWLQWSVGDGLGMVIVAPFVLALAGRLPSNPASRRGEMMLAASITVVVAVCLFVVIEPVAVGLVEWLLLLPLVWVAVRGGVSSSAITVALVLTTIYVAAVSGLGPFGPAATGDLIATVALHGFMAVVGFTAMMLAVRTRERDAYHELAQDRDALLAVVSHELRTPLTPIIGFAELLDRRDTDFEPADRQAIARTIQRNAEQLLTHVDNLLALTQRATGTDPADGTLADAVEVVREVAASYAPTVGVSTDVEHQLVRFSRTQLVTVVNNLVANARFHGAPPVCVSVAVTGDGDVEIAVTDHGVGVPAWFRRRMYRPFEQATTGDRRTSAGLGIGLAICRRLAAANRAALTYDPRFTDGARFVLRVEAVDA